MKRDSKIYVAGHTGLVGSAILEKLIKENYSNIIVRTKEELDLSNQDATRKFFEEEKPEYVFLCAGLVGSLYAAEVHKSEYIYENLMIEFNIINAAFENDVRKLIFFSSADIYSKTIPQPYKETDLSNGQIDFNSNSFIISKSASIKMCESYNSQYGTDFICVVLSNLYGKNQLYDSLGSTVIPALIKRFYEAKENTLPSVKVWGTGNAIRNFIYIDDLVEGIVFLMKTHCDGYLYNISYNENINIRDLAEIIKDEVGYHGQIEFDKEKPEGVFSKLIDTSAIEKLGFKCRISLKEGISKNYKDFITQIEDVSLKQKEIDKIRISKKDLTIYNELVQNNKNEFIQPKDYRNKVVLKPWGYEFLMYENECVAVWFLYIKKGYSTSMHCHPKKKTSLVLLEGKAFSNTFLEKNYLKSNEALILEKGVFHSTKSLSEEGIFLIEVETPPDKTDLVRLRDRYGRQNSGYEGTSEMIDFQIEEKYDYFHFFDDLKNKKLAKTFLSFEIFNNENINNFRPSNNDLVISFKGKLFEKETNKLILDIGDTQYGNKFLSKNSFYSNDREIILLKIEGIDK